MRGESKTAPPTASARSRCCGIRRRGVAGDSKMAAEEGFIVGGSVRCKSLAGNRGSVDFIFLSKTVLDESESLDFDAGKLLSELLDRFSSFR